MEQRKKHTKEKKSYVIYILELFRNRTLAKNLLIPVPQHE